VGVAVADFAYKFLDPVQGFLMKYQMKMAWHEAVGKDFDLGDEVFCFSFNGRFKIIVIELYLPRES